MYPRDTQTALGAYTDDRTILHDRLGLEPGPELTALHQAILHRDPGLPAFPAEVATVAPPAPRAEVDTVAPPDPRAEVAVPRQLPPDPVTFVGRTDELAVVGRALRAAAAGSGPMLVAVFGDGGVGKSTLAARAAHLHRQQFGDGQVFVDLRGPGGSDGALGWALRALGVPVASASRTLERLVDARLLTSGRPGWYRMNEVWRLYAWEMEESQHLPPTEVRARLFF